MSLLLALWGCIPDDWDGKIYQGPPGSTGDSGAGPAVTGDGLPGDWRSEGADRSPLFSEPPFEVQFVEGSFFSDGTYTFTTVNAAGDAATVTGTWEDNGSSPPIAISLSQEEPYEADASGIYELSDEGATLTYEVVQTQPDYGFTPPTPSSGFGSTLGVGLAPGDNVQLFRRQQ